MDNSVVQRLVRGLGAGLYGQATVIVIQLAGVPILLHYWHPQLYGEWLILFAIPAYLSITDLGFSQSAGNDMAARVARGDRAGALAVFQSLTALVLLLAVAGVLIAGAATLTLPIGNWLHVATLSTRDVRWVLWLLAAEVLIRLLDGVSHAGFRAAGDYALHLAISYTTLLAQYASIWLLAALGHGPVAAAASFLIIRAVVTPSVGLLLIRRHRWLNFHLVIDRFSQLRALLRPALANTVLPLAQALNVQGMVLVVGAILGPLAVVVFSTLRTLTRMTLQLVLTVNHATEPELAAAWGNGDSSLFRTLYQHSLRVGLWLALAVGAGLALTGSWIVRFWTQGRVMMDAELFAWLLASAVAGALWYGGLTVLKAANRHLRAAVIYAVAAGCAVVLAAALLSITKNLAPAGMSLLLMDTVMAAYTLGAAAHLCESSAMDTVLSALNPARLLKLLPTRTHAH